MSPSRKKTITVVICLFLILGVFFSPLTQSQQTLGKKRTIASQKTQTILSGQILYSPLYGTNTYLIEPNGDINHTWSSSYTPGAMTFWLNDGTILRTIRTELAGGGGAGGGVQKITWDGTIVWDFRYDTNGNVSHHDIYPLPNGNILFISWERKTRDEAIAAGRDPDTIIGQTFTPDKIIEVQPTGPSSGDIVWEWHAWDHLIQDFDASKDNYGLVNDHPELININYGQAIISVMDWLHVNSIDYNQQYDQILLSVHNFNEIWVIDHSTTTTEAAGHTGGNSGKGGDLLYRWGNPQAYDTGTSSDQKLFNQHDASWITSGCPGEGHILVFNNGVGRPSGQYSSVDEFQPPVDPSGHYEYSPGDAYGPENLVWSYTGTPPTDFFSYYISGAKRLTNGNTLICDGVAGRFFEVTPEKVVLWEYVNSYPTPGLNDVFNIDYIPPGQPPSPEIPDLTCDGELSWTKVKPGTTMQGSFLVENKGGLNSTLNWAITSTPDWGNWSIVPISGENLTPQQGPVTVQVTVVAPDQHNKGFDGFLRVENTDNPEDFNLIPIYLKTPYHDFTVDFISILIQLMQQFFFHHSWLFKH